YNDSCKIKFAVYGWYTDMSGEKELADTMRHNIKLYLNGVEFYNTSWIGGQEYPPKFFEFDAAGLHNGTDTFTIELYKGSSMTKDVIFFDYFEVVCKKKYEAYTGNLKFSGENSLSFALQGFQSSPVIFNITDPLDPKRVFNVDFDTGVVSFQCPGGVYYASDSFKIPVIVIKEENPYNLRNMSQNLDFIIIAHPDFINYANTLKTYREWQGLNTEVFSTADIYNNFSWGIENSPYAIRNFLSYAYDNWGQPGYCLLLGAGTYAYKADVPKNRIPPREEGYKVGDYGYPPQSNYCWDDWFSQHNLAVGRITAKTKIEAEKAIDKITEYEKTGQGVWRNRILLVSDDEYPDRDMFVSNEERCANMVPQEYDVFKVYSMNYPLEGSYKPTAKNDIIRNVDRGMNLLLAAGHGNLYLFCHEILFSNPQDIEALNNGVKDPIWQFWSCGVGCFDRMDDDCMADYLQKIPNKGAIASIAATRTTGGSSGMDTLLVNLLLKQKLNTLGQVVYGQNLSRNLQVNENLFADPATRFPSWSINVEIDSFSDTLMGGTMLEIEGTAPNANFAYITVRSSEYNYTYQYHGYPSITGSTKYKMRGRMVDNQLCEDILFEGITEVKNGKWKESFYIPKLDSIQDSLLWGAYGKISVFAWNDTSCGNAATPVTIMPGGDNPGDTVGPTIQLFVNGVSMGDTINTAEFMFSALLEDESGINVFNKIRPYNLALTLRIKNGQLLPRNIQLADYFQYDTGSCTRGSISYQLSLSEGEDTLELQASDNLKNRTVFSTIVVVGVQETDTLTKLFSFNQNSSNPFIKSTIISYQIPVKSNVSLKLFDLSGRCVKTLIECEKLPGRYEEKLEFKDYPAGIYFVKFNAGTYRETKKLILIK
ncbi:MAG: C25 family cysteine peptidase, partial [bacterium]|nr:C25 family cysteine peptidase [bacterium]